MPSTRPQTYAALSSKHCVTGTTVKFINGQRARRNGGPMFKRWSSPGAWAVLLVAVMLAAASAGSASATIGARRSIKKVKLTVEITPSVTLKGTKGQCLITTDGYNIDFDAKDYPNLGADGGLASGGPGPATAPDQTRLYVAFSATIDGIVYVEDDSQGLDAITSAVTLNVRKKTIKFNAYPIIDPQTEVPATVTGIVRCR